MKHFVVPEYTIYELYTGIRICKFPLLITYSYSSCSPTANRPSSWLSSLSFPLSCNCWKKEHWRVKGTFDTSSAEWGIKEEMKLWRLEISHHFFKTADMIKQVPQGAALIGMLRKWLQCLIKLNFNLTFISRKHQSIFKFGRNTPGQSWLEMQ